MKINIPFFTKKKEKERLFQERQIFLDNNIEHSNKIQEETKDTQKSTLEIARQNSELMKKNYILNEQLTKLVAENKEKENILLDREKRIKLSEDDLEERKKEVRKEEIYIEAQKSETRKKEQEVGCYSGGICFTMAPKLQCLSAFCAAEVWWNPDRKPEEILDDYGRWTFGEGNEKIGRLLEEFEVIPDWGYYPPFPYSAERLRDSMNNLLQELGQLDVKQSPRLPLSVDYASHVETLTYFTTLFRDLAEVFLLMETLNVAFRKTPFAAETTEKVSLAAVQRILATKSDFDGRNELEAAAKKLAEFDVQGMKKQYWDSVYSIYDNIPAQAEDRKPEVIRNVFERRFKASLAERQ